MNKIKQIEYLESLRKSVLQMSFSKSNVNRLEKLIDSELNRELNSENPNKLYVKHLELTTGKSLSKLLNSRKNIENRVDEFNDCKKDLYQDIFHGLTYLK
jgi:hypothetical protein